MFTSWTSVLHAGPRDDLRLFLDFGQLKSVNNDTGAEYHISKISCVQYDYPFTLDDYFSFSLFGTELGGKGVLPDNTKYESYKAGIIGAELRSLDGIIIYWSIWRVILSDIDRIAEFLFWN